MAYNVVPDESFVNPYNFVSLGLKCERHEASEDAKFSGVIRCKLKTLTPLFIPNTTKQFTYKAMVAKGGKPPVEVDCKEMDFFSYEDLRKYTSETYYANHPCPIIPGSSIRGVIRCAFETLTDSCLSTVDDEVLLHRRSSIPKRPGLIITDQTTKQPVLYDAEKLMLNMARHYSDVKGRRIADENLSKFGVDQSRDRLLYHTGQTVYVRKTQRKYGEYKTDRRYVELYGVEEIKTSSTPGFQEGYVLLGED
ncbi:MAG: RAMP superfamily CRISPR-associated protein, partial [Clostridiales bacterium]|nr:RAMP superfamily CRISPR-associated protein [Clostridiales bacterium]